jgi:hypothetical protein
MTLWDMPIHVVDLVLIGGLLLIGVAPSVSGVSQPSPLPVSDAPCQLVPGRFGAPGQYSCPTLVPAAESTE